MFYVVLVLFVLASKEKTGHLLVKVPVQPVPVIARGFQGYGLKDTAKGPQFEETKIQIFSNHKSLE